jgi:transketolase
MRRQLVRTVEALMKEDERLVLLLGDIGVFGFRKALEDFPRRAYNFGILEQATLSAAAGLALDGLIPVVHTIAPFIVERGCEQLKVDFGYQGLGGNFVSVGASYDYAALGCTHHCPGDVGILRNIPGMEIVVPGAPGEFDRLFRAAYANGRPTYYRLSERSNPQEHAVEFGKAVVVKKGARATLLAVGPTLAAVVDASRDLDVTVLYYTTVAPFDTEALRENCPSGRVLLCEPYYSGALTADVLRALSPRPALVACAGVPREFLRNYGDAEEHDEAVGLSAPRIRDAILKLIGPAAP